MPDELMLHFPRIISLEQKYRHPVYDVPDRKSLQQVLHNYHYPMITFTLIFFNDPIFREQYVEGAIAIQPLRRELPKYNEYFRKLTQNGNARQVSFNSAKFKVVTDAF